MWNQNQPPHHMNMGMPNPNVAMGGVGLPPFIPPGGMPMRPMQMPMPMQNMAMFPPQQGQPGQPQQQQQQPQHMMPQGMMPQYQQYPMQQMMPSHMPPHSNNFPFQNVPPMMNQPNQMQMPQPVGILSNSSQVNPMQSNQVISALPSGLPGSQSTQSSSAADSQWCKLFIDNIQSDIPDDFIKKLLEECGPVEKWKRQSDGKGNLNKFGIVEYKFVEGVLKCVRILDGFDIMEEKLVVKPSQTTEKFISQWKQLKRQQFDDQTNKSTEGNSESTQYSSFDEFLEKDDLVIREKLAAHMRSIDEKVEKVRQRKREEEEKRMHPKEKDREAKRKIVQRELEKKYRDKLKEWLDHEQDSIRDQKKEKEREKERERNRNKILDRELTYIDDVDRQKQRTRMVERKRQRQRELEEDENDRRKEIELLNPPEPAFLIPMPDELPPNDFEVVSMTLEAAQNGKEYVESTFRLVEETEFPEEKMVVEEEIIEYSLNANNLRSNQIAQAVDQLNQRSHAQFEQEKLANPHLFVVQTESLLDSKPLLASENALHPSRSLQPTKNVFGNLDEEEEEERKRASRKIELPKIGMSRLQHEEQQQQQQQQQQEQQQQQQVQQAVAPAPVRQLNEEEMKAELKLILSMIPPINEANNAALFGFPLKWDLFDKSGLLETKVKPFLLKKSIEFFREEVMSFVEFIMDMIAVHQVPEKLIKRVQKVLDSDAEKFVAALWRMLIFETLKYERLHLVI